MSKRNRIFLLVAGSVGLILVFFVVLYFSAARLIDTGAVKEKIQTYLIDRTGVHVTYGDSELHFFPVPEIILHRVNVSIPDKAAGSVESLRVYPGLWSLFRGKVRIAKIGLEAPHFIVKVSEDTEKPSMEQIVEDIRSVVHFLVSTTPDLRMAIRDGKLDFTEKDKISFSFDQIQSRLSVSQNTLDIELTTRSSLWDGMSFSASLRADDLKSEGAVRFTRVRPDILLTRIFHKAAEPLSVSEADFSVNFQSLGLTRVQASLECSVPKLEVLRRHKRITMENGKIQANISIDPKTVLVRMNEVEISRPALKLSATYSLDRDSGMMTIDVDGKSLRIKPVGDSAVTFKDDLPVLGTIFDYLRDGHITNLHFHAVGSTTADLGRLKNMGISGGLSKGSVYIRARDLMFHNVAGNVKIEQGILHADNIKATLGNHRVGSGKLRTGLEGKDAPFHLDMQVAADVEQLPALLKQKQLLKNDALLREMDRLRDLRGSAEGRLILGDRLDSIYVKLTVDDMNIMARYEPLPFPLALTEGRFFFNEKTVELADSGGSIGGSSFSGLTARLSLTDPSDLEITGGDLSVSADEIYPWITSFEKIKPVLKDVRSVKGVVSVSSLNLRGPLHQPKKWKFHINGEAKKLTLDAASLPGKAEEISGTFVLKQNELSVKNMRSKIVDSPITVTGTVSEFPSDIRTVDLALQGDIGPEVNAWLNALLKLQPKMKIRAPFSVANADLSWERGKRSAFSGKLLFGRETHVSLSLTKTPDTLSLPEVVIKDRFSNATAKVMLSEDTIDVAFRGNLKPQTLNTIFADSLFSDASLEGDLRSHIVLRKPDQSSAEGTISGSKIPILWDRDIPLVVERVSAGATGQRAVIHTAQVFVGGMQFRTEGTVSILDGTFNIALNLFSDGIDWETLQSLLRKSDKAEDSEKKGFLKDLPVRGSLSVRSDFLKYNRFSWEPFHADLSFDGETARAKINNSALCGISATGDLSLTGQEVTVDIALSAKDLDFRPTVLCLTNERADYTGTFQVKARLEGKGTTDEIADSLIGAFHLSAKDGKILKSESLHRTLDLLNESENLRGEFPDIEKEIISYSVLDVRGKIQGHILNIEEGVLDASVMGIMAHGSIDLNDQTLDLKALVAPLKTVRRIVGKIPVFGHILGGNLVSVPVRISGHTKNPQVTFLSPTAVGSEILGIFERTIKLPITLIEPVFPGKEKK